MPRSRCIGAVKAANLHRTKSKAKVIEWETQVYSQGIRDVPVEVSGTESQPKLREKAGKRPRAENNDMLQGETAAPMDIGEEFWVEERMPASKRRVSQAACPFLASLRCISDPAQLHRSFYS